MIRKTKKYEVSFIVEVDERFLRGMVDADVMVVASVEEIWDAGCRVRAPFPPMKGNKKSPVLDSHGFEATYVGDGEVDDG